jgi:hypothetical protein
VPGAKTPTLVAVGPSGTDYSTDDGRTWTALEGPGFDTLSFVRVDGHHSQPIAFAAGARGSIGTLMLGSRPVAGSLKVIRPQKEQGQARLPDRETVGLARSR